MMRMAFGESLTMASTTRFDHVVVGLQQIVAAHARLARETGGDHDDVAIGGVAVVAGRGGDARDVRVGAA